MRFRRVYILKASAGGVCAREGFHCVCIVNLKVSIYIRDAVHTNEEVGVMNVLALLSSLCCNALQNVQLQAGRTVFSQCPPSCF